MFQQQATRFRTLFFYFQTVLILAVMFLAFSPMTQAGTFNVFGPELMQRNTTKPVVIERHFSVPTLVTPYSVKVTNGSVFGAKSVSSAIVTINGEKVLGTSDFNQQMTVIERPVSLTEQNTLRVELRGAPTGAVKVEFFGIDNTPPTIVATVSPEANAAGWHNQDVTVSFECTDGESGVAVCQSPITVTTEGAGQVVHGMTADLAGNINATSVVLNIDKTAPTIVASASPQANANGWNNQDVTVSFNCSDSLSSVGQCQDPITLSSEGANQVASGTAVDVAGNVSSASASVNIDKTPPDIAASVSPQANAAGWHNQDVTVSFSCSDAVSDITQCQEPITVFSEGANQAVSGSAVDLADNSNTVSAIVNIDKTAPTISITSPTNNSVVTDSSITVTGTVSDGNTVTVSINGAVATLVNAQFSHGVSLAEGDNVVSVQAVDVAGNQATSAVSVTYETQPQEPLPPDPATVAPELDSTVTTSISDSVKFLYTGANPIQTGMAESTIKEERVAVLRGRVLNRDNQPLGGIVISIKDRPYYGQTLSRADGLFDMVVNGGELLTVQYQKDGLLPVQRKMDTHWRDYFVLPDVVMIELDPNVTSIDFSANQMQVARGSVITEEGGWERQATVLFPVGTTAELVYANGTRTSVSTLSVRATEYTVGPNGPNAMPAELPPNSGYTYAVEMSVDEALATGAKTVEFNQAVPFYLDNFLGFPAGTPVPVGVYDSDLGIWLPRPNGTVITILSIDNGLAVLDVDGSGNAASAQALADMGITDAERAQLAALYSAQDSVWRVPLTHFSPYDFNYPYLAEKLPDGAEGSNQEQENQAQVDMPNTECGSIISCENQSLGEVVKITGTPYSLVYDSSRVRGSKKQISINLSGDTVPSELKRIDLEVTVVGRKFAYRFEPQPNLKHTFVWDGKDAYGREYQGQTTALVRVSFVYDIVYYKPPGWIEGWTELGVDLLSMYPETPNREARFTDTHHFPIGGVEAKAHSKLGGWTLNVHHSYSHDQKVLYKGDGTHRTAANLHDVIETYRPDWLDGGLPGGFGPVTALSMDPSGHFFKAARGGLVSEALNPDYDPMSGVFGYPTLTFFRQYGWGSGFNFEEGPGRFIQMSEIGDYSEGITGRYVADTGNHRIRKLVGGYIKTMAGSGVSSNDSYYGGFGGDGGPATSAQLNRPGGVLAAPDGYVYIADTYNHRIRRISPTGIITTFAGTGVPGYSGDGQLARYAQFNTPSKIKLGHNGDLLVVDTNNHAIRKIRPDGTIFTVAGNGTQGYSGDGLEGSQAQLNRPNQVALSPDGGIVISDFGNHAIRKISADGYIKTVGGGGGSAGNSITTHNLMVMPDNTIAFYGNWLMSIRKPMPGFTTSDTLLPSADGSLVYVFDRNGRHLRTHNATTGSVLLEFGYDSNGYLVSVTDAGNNTTVIERAGADPVAFVSPDQLRTTLDLEANGYLGTVTFPDATTEHYTYNAKGFLLTKRDRNQNESVMTYDDFGKLIRDENASGGFFELDSVFEGTTSKVTLTSAEGRVTRYDVGQLKNGAEQRVVTAPDGTQTVTTRNNDGSTTVLASDGTLVTTSQGPDPRFGMQAPYTNSATIETPSGLVSQTATFRQATISEYNNELSLLTQTDTTMVNGRQYVSVFNKSNLTVTSTSPEGRQQTNVVDADGRLLQSQIPGFLPTNYEYDNRGRLISISQGNRNTLLDYNANGYLGSMTDALSRSVIYDRDLMGRVLQQTNPDTHSVGFDYDDNGNIAAITPPGRSAHEYGYTVVDLNDEYRPPALSTGPTNTLYDYNLDKQLTKVTRADSLETDFVYDNAGRLDQLLIPRGTISYNYLPTTGQLGSITTPDSTLSYSYDGGLLKNAVWSGTIAGSVSRNYDNNFWVTEISVNSDSIAYDYDLDGLMIQAGSLSIQRNPQNGLVTGTQLGGTNTGQSYTAYGELETINANHSGNTLYSATYSYDDLGRISTKTETVNGITQNFTYEYDLVNRLDKVYVDGSLQSDYDFDPNGNRIGGFNLDGPISAGYDEQDRLNSYNGIAYTYSANGELQSKTDNGATTQYHYDVLSNLMQVTLPDNTQIEYIIDGNNRRIGKKVNGTLVQGFLYQDQLNPIAELDGNNNVVSRFVYGQKPYVPDYMVKNGQTYRIISDHLGSVRLVVDLTTGGITQRMDYDEYGNVLVDTNPGFQPFGFAGGIYDVHTELVRFGARDYDSKTGRWTTKDPIGLAGGINVHEYVSSNPINYIDPKGLCILGAAICSALPTTELDELKNVLMDKGWEKISGKICKDVKSCNDIRDNIVELVGDLPGKPGMPSINATLASPMEVCVMDGPEALCRRPPDPKNCSKEEE